MQTYKELIMSRLSEKLSHLQNLALQGTWFCRLNFVIYFNPIVLSRSAKSTRVACNYVKLIISGSENVHRETFFKRFPSLVCQAVYTVFCRAFPTSYRQFDDRFKQDLADVTYQWIAGNWMFLFVFMIPFCDV